MDDMTDAEFLSYVDIHSRTDLALFCAAHCRRLFALANMPFPEPDLPDTAFRAMHSENISDVLYAATQRNTTSNVEGKR